MHFCKAATGHFPLLVLALLAASARATVLIFWTGSDGTTHCEVRHDLDDCGFANVNPAVDCFPWFDASSAGGDGGGAVVVNDAAVDPAEPGGGGGWEDAVPPAAEDARYDLYFVREACLLRGGTKLTVRKIDYEKSNGMAVARLAASAGCGDKFGVVSVPASKKDELIFGEAVAVAVSRMVIQQERYGEISLDGVAFEIE